MQAALAAMRARGSLLAPERAMPLMRKSAGLHGGNASHGLMGRFVNDNQVGTSTFKEWYGEWQNSKEGGDHGAQGYDDGGRDSAVNAVQSAGGLGQDSHDAVTVGDFTFSGSSGPVGRNGKPAVFFYGTRDDVETFELRHPHRKDHGWLGRGVYAASDPLDAASYAAAKRGSGHQNIMPLYVAVRRPFVATKAVKQQLKNASPAAIDLFTQDLKDKGHDGVVMGFEDGHVELAAFEPTQVKSAVGN